MAGPTVPSTMKAIVQRGYGGPEVLRMAEVPVPEPDATSVLVRVKAASINALDWRIVSGQPWIGRILFFGFLRPKRPVRGVDVAGDVVKVVKPDSRFHVGDAVFGLGSGSFSEYVAADERELVTKPAGVSYVQGATLGVAAFTALQGLRDSGKVKVGESVLVLAAGSGVGTFAIQLAKWMGARVTAATTTDNVELVRSIGADAVLDYAREDFTQRAESYDCILDISGRYSLGACRKRLTPSGRVVVVGARGGISHILWASLLGRLTGGRVRSFVGKARVADLELLGGLVADGHLRPVVAREYPLGEGVAAMAEAGRHHARGKLVLSVS